MHSAMKSEIVAILNGDKSVGEQLDASERTYLRRWATYCADNPIWDEVINDARALNLHPNDSLYSTVIWYALHVRRLAEGMKFGDDPYLREDQARRARHLALAEKAEDLGRYYEEAEKYSGVAMFWQRFLKPVQQLRELHEREAQLLRQRAGREPQPMIQISRQDRGKGAAKGLRQVKGSRQVKKGLRQVRAFIELMTLFMRDEICGKEHRSAVALLTDIAFPGHDVDTEYVREILRYGKRVRRTRKIRELNAKKP
jgi:hypothetical protein